MAEDEFDMNCLIHVFLTESPKTEEFGAANASTGDFDRTSSDGLRTDKTPASEPRGFRSEDTAPTSGGYADPTSAFPGAPIDRRVEEPGYGYDQQSTLPVLLSLPWIILESSDGSISVFQCIQ